MNSKKNLLKFKEHVTHLSEEVYKELGSGFKEDTLQQALAIAFRQSNVKYLRETHLEIFYKKESLGLFRLDFFIPAQKNKKWELKRPVIIETKASAKLNVDARLQLKNYLISLPRNTSEELKHIKEGLLINWNNRQDPLDLNSINQDVETELWELKRQKFQLIHTNIVEKI